MIFFAPFSLCAVVQIYSKFLMYIFSHCFVVLLYLWGFSAVRHIWSVKSHSPYMPISLLANTKNWHVKQSSKVVTLCRLPLHFVDYVSVIATEKCFHSGSLVQSYALFSSLHMNIVADRWNLMALTFLLVVYMVCCRTAVYKHLSSVTSRNLTAKTKGMLDKLRELLAIICASCQIRIHLFVAA